jgi:tripartite-type tricarboxylate transporter receptor subunit TctC
MKNRTTTIGLSLLFFASWNLLFTLSIQAQTEAVYSGKTIRIVAGSAAGGGVDFWSRLIGRHMGKHLSGPPSFIVQNMPGGGSIAAANYIYNLAKPDGLTIGLVNPALYFDQLAGRKEVQFDWARFTWIGSTERSEEIFYVRADAPYKSLDDIRKSSEPPKCGAVGTSAADYYFPKLLEEALGLRLQMVVGYTGTADINLAIERGEVLCRAGTISTFFGREPTRTWSKTGFVRVLIQGGSRRDSRLADAPTIYELMDRFKTSDAARRLVKVVLSAGEIGRPVIGPPVIPADRVKMLREAFIKTVHDPEFLAEAKRAGWDTIPVSGEALEAIAKEIIEQPPGVIESLKKLLGV